jgi:hypothetical protein
LLFQEIALPLSFFFTKGRHFRMTTHRKPAKDAGKLLGSKKTPKDVKRVAASDPAPAKKPPKKKKPPKR